MCVIRLCQVPMTGYYHIEEHRNTLVFLFSSLKKLKIRRLIYRNIPYIEDVLDVDFDC